MSFKVLVIPEDPTYNGAILKPVVERIFTELHKPQAQILVLTDPRVQGLADAKRAIREDLPKRYGRMPLWLFVPDADRCGDLTVFERERQAEGIPLLCCPARPELEAWLLAGFRDRLACGWDEVREHPRLKEEVFKPFLASHGNSALPDQGRGMLMRRALRNYRGLRQACDEIGVLEQRIDAFLAERRIS